jgi:hypothetical protein
MHGLCEFRLGSVRLDFDFILHTAHTVDVCALTSILPSRSLINMTYFSEVTKVAPASIQGVGVNFLIFMDFASAQLLKRVGNRTARFRCFFGSTDGYGI